MALITLQISLRASLFQQCFQLLWAEIEGISLHCCWLIATLSYGNRLNMNRRVTSRLCGCSSDSDHRGNRSSSYLNLRCSTLIIYRESFVTEYIFKITQTMFLSAFPDEDKLFLDNKLIRNEKVAHSLPQFQKAQLCDHAAKGHPEILSRGPQSLFSSAPDANRLFAWTS